MNVRELPECGRMVVTESGNYYRCRNTVISSVIPCPRCRDRASEDDVSGDQPEEMS